MFFVQKRDNDTYYNMKEWIYTICIGEKTREILEIRNRRQKLLDKLAG